MAPSKATDDIIEIDGQKYLIPTVFKDGQLVSDVANKIKLPIPITDRLHICYASEPLPRPTFKKRLISILTLGLR
jgi:hypothetical protein